MPKLRALNFDLVKQGNPAEIKKMIKDLLMLYPRGASMTHKKEEYTVRQGWRGKYSYLSSHYNGNEDWNETQSENWGYTDEQMYCLIQGLGHDSNQISEWHFQGMLTRKLPDYVGGWSNAKWTRTCKRLNDRISKAYARACKSGKLGDLLWNVDVVTLPVQAPRGVRWSWQPGTQVTVVVPARTPAEATMLVDACFGHAINMTNKGRPHGWKQGGDAAALIANQACVQDLQKSREHWQTIIEKAQEQIAHIEMLSEAIDMYSLSAFGEAEAAGEDN